MDVNIMNTWYRTPHIMTTLLIQLLIVVFVDISIGESNSGTAEKASPI